MKIGDYVRTKRGITGKIKAIDNQTELEDLYLVKRKWYYKEDIIKSSPNIIDLIEVGDIIKFKELRTHITNDSGTKYYEDYICDIHSLEELENIKQEIIGKHIKLTSVITKEQFEEMEYRI